MRQRPISTASPSPHRARCVSCVYIFESGAVLRVARFTVTVSHTQAGNRPLALGQAGASTSAEGYAIRDVGDLARTTPSSDLRMRIGRTCFPVVGVAQPGFVNPVERNAAMSMVVLAVARGAADRMPTS